MTVAQLMGGTLSGGLTSRSSEWNNINKMTGSFYLRQPKGPCNFISLVDRDRLSHGGVFRHCSLSSNHRTMLLSSRLVGQRRHNFSVVNNQPGPDCGVHSSSFVDENSAIEEGRLINSIERAS